MALQYTQKLIRIITRAEFNIGKKNKKISQNCTKIQTVCRIVGDHTSLRSSSWPPVDPK